MRKSKIIQNQKEQINKMIDDICDLEKEIEELKHQLSFKEEELLKKYDYAILVKNYKTQLWNDGRFENKVRQISFDSNENGYLPELTIWK